MVAACSYELQKQSEGAQMGFAMDTLNFLAVAFVFVVGFVAVVVSCTLPCAGCIVGGGDDDEDDEDLVD